MYLRDMKRNIFLLFIGLIGHLKASTQELNVERINIKNGLSSSNITAIVQDTSGFMWLGTYNGLNRYDGKSFKVYQNIQGDTNSLSNNQITALFCDSKGRLWIGNRTNKLILPKNRK